MSKKKTTKSSKNTNLERRDLIKGLATVPVAGVFLVNLWRKMKRDATKKANLLSDLVQEKSAPNVVRSLSNSRHLNIGIIGYGGRGGHLVRGAGFATKGWTDTVYKNAQKNKLDKQFDTFMSQEDLNCSLIGVCDLFDNNAELGINASQNEIRPGGMPKNTATRYRTHEELLANDNIDAVIIATPDHWHAQITIDAAKAGKHVYCEKGMTRTFDEAIKVYDAVKETGITFEVGHENRQVEANEKGRQIYEQGLLGPLNLVELTTNRNSPWGAWYWGIHPDGNNKTIDWERFQQPSPNKLPWGNGKEALERFFRWRCWFDYGTGLSGDLLSHDFDTINQIMDIGIPKYVTSSGGIYHYTKKNYPDIIGYDRDVPDVWNATFEYPERDLTLLYSASLSSSNPRGNRIMGHDATMQMGGQSGGGSIHGFVVTADELSTQYKDRLDSGIINPNYPIYTYSPGSKQIDGVTSATSRYFAQKGLLYTYREGKRVDPTHLHVKDWLDSIRDGSQPRCNIDVGFHEAVACAMATESYLKGRRIEWDPVNRKLI